MSLQIQVEEIRSKEFKDRRFQVLSALRLPGKSLLELREDANISMPDDQLFRTITDMEDKGFIQVVGWVQRRSLWIITESGRMLLAEYERT